MIERRKVLAAGAALLVSPTTSAQRRTLPVIGFLGAGTAPSWKLWTDTFVKRLAEIGNRRVPYRDLIDIRGDAALACSATPTSRVNDPQIKSACALVRERRQ